MLRVWGAYIWRGLFSEFYGTLKQQLVAQVMRICSHEVLSRSLVIQSNIQSVFNDQRPLICDTK